MPHDLFSVFASKAVEYPLALVYLALFIPFWRYVNGGRGAAEGARVRVEARPKAPFAAADLFAVPDSVHFHPGHSWARFEGGLATAGLDEFGHKLVGRIDSIRLPEVGATLAQGEHGWALVAGGRTIDVLSPVDGEVVAVNARAVEKPEEAGADPYGEGWLVRVRAPRPDRNARQLMRGALAKRWTELSWESLAGMNLELGPVALDGGRPVNGMARAGGDADWDRVASTFFLTGGGACAT